MTEGRIVFVLDERLERDTLPIGAFTLCRLLLMNDAQYPWFILVPQRENITEVFQLSLKDQATLWKEASLLAEVVKDTFAADKMNLAALGNVVSQLHVHVIARTRQDEAWPDPVWGARPAVPYTSEQFARLEQKLRIVLAGEVIFHQGEKI